MGLAQQVPHPPPLVLGASAGGKRPSTGLTASLLGSVMGKHRACSKRKGAVSTGLAGAGQAVPLGFDTGHSGAGRDRGSWGCVVGKHWACSRLRVCCGQALGLLPT